ncbi:MAG TPA: 50S ribosomal protein L6 [Candidatus Limnocylindrales bacterium]|nr:50S ribosomal protein L6 [Candidatus Limnocylindrales bacterium]
MSKVGKLPITIANGVNLTDSEKSVQVTGPKGSATVNKPEGLDLAVNEGIAVVSAKDPNDKKIRAMFGMFRANLANAVKGVDTGFEKKLEMTGVGYRAVIQGADLVLSVGYSHPVKFSPKEGIKLAVADNVISVLGIDKAMVGEMAAEIRAVRPPEPYKGKGIRYQGEYIRRKAGKAAKAAGATK